MSLSPTYDRIRALRRDRPRSAFLHWSGVVILSLVVAAWWAGDFSLSGLLSPRRLENVQRFLGEIRPYPLQGRPWDWGAAWRWAYDVAARKGTEATLVSLALSVVSIVIAGFGGLLLALPATRTWSTPEPYIPASHRVGWPRKVAWRALVTLSRAALVFLRALPEYVWAFIFLMLIGPTAWPIVLALAIHNIGILGKLDAEVIENLPSRPLAALRGVGAGRLGIAGTAIFPSILPRFLLLFFYRWETCVRESTVLGMLGIVSLGFWIVDARARQLYDEMIFLVLLGAMLVLVGDLVSAAVRGWVRRAS